MIEMLALAALLAQGPAQETGPSQPASAPAAAAPAHAASRNASDDVVTCREERTTGTMIADRECHTNAQWRAMSDEAQDEYRDNSRLTATPK